MFFVIVLIFCLVFSTPVFAHESFGSNVQFYNYIITYTAQQDFVVSSSNLMPTFTSWTPMTNFAKGLFRQSGSRDVVDNYFYLYDFDFIFFDLTIYNSDGTVNYHNTSPSRVNGTAWFNVDTAHTVNIPFSTTTNPVTYHARDWATFENAELNSRYSLWSFSSRDVGKRCVIDYKYRVRFGSYFYANLGDVIDAIHQDNSDVTSAIDRQTEQQKQYHDRDESDATAAKKQIIGVTDELDKVQNKWAILWYPITFTNKVLGAFTGQRARDGDDNYIVGYNYNDDTGGLEPIYDFTRVKRAGSASITFPSFTLPVLNLKLWDSYTYDLSQLPKQFPVLFNAIYVVVGVLELYWFVGFLSDKYHQIFGG